MKVSTIGGKPLISGGKVVTTPGNPCACGDCGGSRTTGACCADDGSCTITTEAECDGTYQGNGTVCDPNPCIGSCCIGDGCEELSESACHRAGGEWHQGAHCSDDPCPCGEGHCELVSACCFDSDCEIVTSSFCSDNGGVPQGDGSICTPNPCPGACPCGFLNPDDGLYYKTKTYTNTANTPICPTAGPCCISFNTGASCCPPYTGARWYFSTTCGVSYLTSESYDAFCDYSSEHETVNRQRYFGAHCLLEGGVATPDCSGVCNCLEPDCNVQACPPADPCNPTGWIFCQAVTTTVEYSDLCILNPGGFSVFGDSFFRNN